MLWVLLLLARLPAGVPLYWLAACVTFACSSVSGAGVGRVAIWHCCHITKRRNAGAGVCTAVPCNLGVVCGLLRGHADPAMTGEGAPDSFTTPAK